MSEILKIFIPLLTTGAILAVALTFLSAILEAKNAVESEESRS